MDFATGFAIGFLFVILFVIIVSLNKNKKIGGEYDEKLSSGIMNFVCGITLFVISLAGVVKLMLNKREDE